MKDDERRSILRSLTDEEYLDVMEVCASMPYVTLEIKSEGKKLLDIYIYIYTLMDLMDVPKVGLTSLSSNSNLIYCVHFQQK